MYLKWQVKQENTKHTFTYNNANTYHRLFHRHDNNYALDVMQTVLVLKRIN